MNNFNIKNIFAILLIVLTSCSYKPIFSEKNYNFEINEIVYSGDKQISNIIKNKLNLIKKSEGQSKKEYNLSISNSKEKIIVSKDSKGDPLKFELIVTTTYEVKNDGNLLFTSIYFCGLTIEYLTPACAAK